MKKPVFTAMMFVLLMAWATGLPQNTASAENNLALAESPSEYTIYLEGQTRLRLDEVYLTEECCRQLKLRKDPIWSLSRISGTSLTLRTENTSRTLDDGTVIYGCEIVLYSVSSTGDTVYELSCEAGNQKVSRQITVSSVSQENLVPAAITFARTTYSAAVNEMIMVDPYLICIPETSVLPREASLRCTMNDRATAAMNQADYFVSRERCIFSFRVPGTYEVVFHYFLSNLQYSVPVTLQILDESGMSVIQAEKITLNHSELFLVLEDAANTAVLSAAFTPANVTNQQVSWESSNPDVATVTADGRVEAKNKGTAIITCTPSDSGCRPATCFVTVEEWFTIENVEDSFSLFLEGKQNNTLFNARLSEGTIRRLEEDGQHVVWMLIPNEGTCVEAQLYTAPDHYSARVDTERLLQSGISSFTLACETELCEWSHPFTVVVEELAGSAPESVSLENKEVRLALGETVTVDFTPVCLPEGASIPVEMENNKTYYGCGGFYDALDRSVCRRLYNSQDRFDIAFTEEGEYLLLRVWRYRNLSYVVSCLFIVGETEEQLALLKTSETDYTVYMNGKSAVASELSIDAGLYETLGGQVLWGLEKVSGNSTSAALEISGYTTSLLILSTEKQGQDVWRVSCSIQGITVYQDITVNAVRPRKPLPESIDLALNQATGVIGEPVYVPIGVQCLPEGSNLPDSGDEFWSFRMETTRSDAVSEWSVENSLLRVSFRESGYYTGTLVYSSGNVKFEKKIYFKINDEEGQIATPGQLTLLLQNHTGKVYPEGRKDVCVAVAALSINPNVYLADGVEAYIKDRGSQWSLTPVSGDSVSLSIREIEPGTAELLLSEVNGVGETSWRVSCEVEGITWSVDYDLTVADQEEERPVPELETNEYITSVGEGIKISNVLRTSTGAVLQSNCNWKADEAMEAINYRYYSFADGWYTVFYQKGTYQTSVDAYVGNLLFELPLTIHVINGMESERRILILPAGLIRIEDEAFAGLPIENVDARNTQLSHIGKNAFRDCEFLTDVYLPNSLQIIEDTAFSGCGNIVIHCTQDSYADEWAGERQIRVIYDPVS